MLQSTFQTILVPVDFSINTDVAVKKTLEIIDTNSSTVHLLHVVKSGLTQEFLLNIEKKLNEWRSTIEESFPGISVFCEIERSLHVQHCIHQTAKRIHADLVVIGKRSSHTWLPLWSSVQPMKIPEITGIPVLSVKPGALHNRIRTVVVPIADEMPRNKMAALEVLCKRQNLHVHLITFNNNQDCSGSTSALLKVFKWLKSTMKCQVEYSLLQGYCSARSILEYAETVKADILLVNPDSETKIGWLNRQLPDVLANTSKMQVLAIQPAISY
ncbi:MAG: universal stress protein [Flavisolibacter sp.]|jgi:nucleotide-binding universal stress UspA family protein